MFKSILNSHKLILEKILKKSNDGHNNMQKDTKMVKSLNDLFNKYLYFLRIYSPFVSIDNNTIVKQKTEASNNEITKENDMKLLDENNILPKIQSNKDNESFLEEISIFNTKNDYPFLDLNLPNNYSSKSFFNASVYFK